MKGWLLLAAVLWMIFGTPLKTIANQIWPDSPAPWEAVDAFYYPDTRNMDRDSRALGLKSVDECQKWVWQQARASGDPGMLRGAYACGVGYLEEWNGLRVYRTKVR